MTDPIDVLTAGKAKAVAFDTARKGYDTDQVDAFIDHVCQSLAWYANELDDARAAAVSSPAVVETVEEVAVVDATPHTEYVTEYVTDPAMEQKVAEAVNMAEQAHALLKEQNETLAQKDAQIAELQDALDLAKMAPPASAPVDVEPLVAPAAPVAASKSAAMVLQRAQETADQVMADAEAEAAALLAAAQGESEQAKAQARSEADELLSSARAEAEAVRSDAQLEADRLLGDAQSQATDMVTEAEGKVQDLSAKISDLSETEASYRRQLVALVDRTRSHLDTPIVLSGTTDLPVASDPAEEEVVVEEQVVVETPAEDHMSEETVENMQEETFSETSFEAQEDHQPQPPTFGDWVHHSDSDYSSDQGYLGS